MVKAYKKAKAKAKSLLRDQLSTNKRFEIYLSERLSARMITKKKKNIIRE